MIPVMKNTLILNREDLAIRFEEVTMEHIKDIRNEVDIREYAQELKQLGEDIQDMLSDNLEVSRLSFLDAFRSGFTISILSEEEFQLLEKWSANDEEFQVSVFTENGKPVGLFNQDIVQW